MTNRQIVRMKRDEFRKRFNEAMKSENKVAMLDELYSDISYYTTYEAHYHIDSNSIIYFQNILMMLANINKAIKEVK